MTESRWRKRARKVIQEAIRRVGRSDEKSLKAAISAAYPFGARTCHPYKIWLDEVKVQLGEKKIAEHVPGVDKIVPLPGQKELF